MKKQMRTKKSAIICILSLLVLILFSCKPKVDSQVDVNIIEENNTNKVIDIANEQFIICDYDLFDNSIIYMLKSHQAGQMLSIIIKNKNDELIIFDGGRIDDAKYLCEFIKHFGGKVKYWFLTHIHDDHIGAIFEIFRNYSNEIHIENLCYNFADYDWYYEKAGSDADALILFNQAKENYIKTLSFKNLKMNINNKIAKNDLFAIEDVKIKVMNNIYKLDTDSINNSTIVYKAEIENKTMIILGDLGYEAGELFVKEYEKSDLLKSNIVVLAHHGQAGVDYKVYNKIAPKIALWPATEYIYENKSGKLKTDLTKEWLKSLNVKENILSFIGNYIIE